MIANEWVECIPCSFTIDAYEYIWRDDKNDHPADLVCLNEWGFRFRTHNHRIVQGPMSSIQAVEYAEYGDNEEEA
jgi:hypothetical protein